MSAAEFFIAGAVFTFFAVGIGMLGGIAYVDYVNERDGK